MGDTPERLAQEYYEVKEKIRALEARRKKLRSSLFSIFDRKRGNEICSEDIKVYRVNRPRITWNEKLLESILIEKGLLYQVLSPDPKKVKELISKGLISDTDLEKAKITKDLWYTYAVKLNSKKKIPSSLLKENHQNTKIQPKSPFQPYNNVKVNLGPKTLIITDLSRMKDDRVCICGVDSQGTTIRPILPYGVRRRNLVDRYGNFIIKPFAVVKFELMKPRPEPPHMEDVRWDLIRGPVFMRNLSGQEQKELMEHLAYNHVQEIFSAPIFENRFIKEGDGLRSIGTLKPHEIIAIDFIKNSEGNYNYYMEFMDKEHETFKLPVTDCAFLKYFDKGLDNGYSPDEISDDLRDKFEKNESFLRLSLTPSFKNAHWIQITGAYNYP